jgi:hypothetical protein
MVARARRGLQAAAGVVLEWQAGNSAGESVAVQVQVHQLLQARQPRRDGAFEPVGGQAQKRQLL